MKIEHTPYMKVTVCAVFAFIVLHTAYGQSFTLSQELSVGLRGGSISVGDVNSDGYLDFIQTGSDIDGNAHTKLYLFDGTSFQESSTTFPDLLEGMSDFGDFDNDGDLDLLLAGSSTDGTKSRLYENNRGSFTLADDTYIEGVDRGSVEFGDYDNDGDLDILLSGQNASSQSITKIYRNEKGVFSEVKTDKLA